MANLQHYIHYKLQNKPIMFRSSKKGSKEGRKEGREEEKNRGMDFTHAFFDTDTCGVILFAMWWMKSQYDT